MRRPAVLVWSVFAVGASSIAAAIVLGNISDASAGSEPLWEEILLIVSFTALPAMGALVASRYPRNAVGWLFLWIGAGVGLSVLTSEYAHWGLVQEPGRHPGATLAAWGEQWLWLPSIGVIPTLVLLLFPNGRPPSRRWRWLAWASGATVAWVAIRGMVEERLEGDGYSVDNPIGIPGLGDVEESLGLVNLILVVLIIFCAASLVLRFRRSRGEERQQLKLLAFSAALIVAGILLTELFHIEVPGLFAITLLLFATSLGVSMLKYRLYDIDLIINRTLVYGAVTAVLAGVYAVGVVGFGAVLRELANQETNNLAVAASTLAVAAMFRPARARIQGLIDRRFYRRKYDAVKTLESFNARLRDEVDLDALTGDLLVVVRDTMQPAHASLWLRTSEGTK